MAVPADPSLDSTFGGAELSVGVEAGDVPELQLGVAREQVRRALFGGQAAEHSIDRFVLLESVGRGGMGEVFAAYDPQLDRRVALKLVTPSFVQRGGHDQLVAEARAMAKVSHPNVVTVFEVGVHRPKAGEPLVFLAMEFVRGKTLRAWVQQTSPSWQRIVEAYRAVGRGLVAMHAAGLVHRDVKPDNAMIDDDGHVRLMDFGLAHDLERTGGPVTTSAELGATIEEITQGGTRMGTPAYMAPEQLEGLRADHRTDQFGLCVALYEALWGRRPWQASSIAELVVAVLDSDGPPAPPRSPVPTRIRDAIARGLSRRRGDRWPTMQALLHALGESPTRTRNRVVVGLAAVGATAGVVWSYGRYDQAQRIAACEAHGSEIDDAWNPARKQALYDAMVATEVSSATITADKVMPWLDLQASAWREARVDACLDAEVREIWSTDTLDRSLWCLDERRMELAALVDELTRADARVLVRAVAAASELASVAPCRDAGALAMVGPPPPLHDREAVQSVRAEVAHAAALDRAGRYDQGLAAARDALAHAEALEWRPLVARARHRMGALLARTGAVTESEAAFEDAYFEASDGVAPEVVFDSAVSLVYAAGLRAARPGEGVLWGRLAEVALADIHDGEGLRRAGLLASLATVRHALGEFAESTRLLEEALALQLEALPQEHPQVATTLANLGNAAWAAEDYARAKSLHERALAMREKLLGAEHPDVAVSLGNLAAVHQSTGEYARAGELFERALAISESALGPEHPSVAVAINNVAVARQTAGDEVGAKTMFVRALELSEQVHGREHPDVAMALNNLGLVHERLGEIDEARAAYERALVIWEATLGPEHPDLGYALVGLCDVALTQGRAKDAVEIGERAVAIFEAGGIAAEDLADARYALAKALWEAPDGGGRDRTRALRLVEQAREVFRDAGPGRAEHLADTRAWLDKRGGPPLAE